MDATESFLVGIVEERFKILQANEEMDRRNQALYQRDSEAISRFDILKQMIATSKAKIDWIEAQMHLKMHQDNVANKESLE